MEIEELTKSQLILLTLLVSFVTSIATGIVTVTLMEEAPENVSRTITHVVERTVEKVTPIEEMVEKETQTASVVEVPVIVTEEELVVEAINKNSPAVGVLKIVSEVEEEKVEKRLGTIFLSDGNFKTVNNFIKEEEVDYFAELESGQSIPLILNKVNGQFADFNFKEGDYELPKVSIFKSENSPQIGQSIIILSATGAVRHKVTMGVIGSMSGSSTSTPAQIFTNAASLDQLGAPVLNIYGDILGIVTGEGVASVI